MSEVPVPAWDEEESAEPRTSAAVPPMGVIPKAGSSGMPSIPMMQQAAPGFHMTPPQGSPRAPGLPLQGLQPGLQPQMMQQQGMPMMQQMQPQQLLQAQGMPMMNPGYPMMPQMMQMMPQQGIHGGMPMVPPMQQMMNPAMMAGSMTSAPGWWQPGDMRASTSSGSWILADVDQRYEKGKTKGKGEMNVKGASKGDEKKDGPRKLPKPIPKKPIKKEEKIPDEFDEDPPDDDGDGSEYSYTYEYEEEDEHGEEETMTNDPTYRSSNVPSRQTSNAGDMRPPLPRRKREDGPAEPRRTATKSRAAPTGSARDQRSSAPPSEGSGQTDAIRDILTRNMRKGPIGERGGGGTRSALSQVKVETFRGSRSAYRDWKKTLQVQRGLYKLTDPEMAALVYLSTSGEARDIVNQLEVSELQEEASFSRVMKLLDDTYEKQADERFEQKQEEFMTFRRPHGMAMSAYIAKLRRLKAEYLKEDPDTVISDRAYAQRLLTRAGLSKKERTEIFFAAGGKYRSEGIEKVLRFRCATMHTEEVEKYRYGRPHGDLKGSKSSRKVYHRGSGARSSTWRLKKRNDAHLTEAEPENEEDPDEDFQEEEADEDLDNEDLEQEAYPADVRDYVDHGDDEPDWGGTEEEDEEWEMSDLREAYAAGWKARQQSAEMRKGRGYKGQGKGKKGGKQKSRPEDNRRVEDRKKASKCAICHKYGHWKGDPQCPKVKSGEYPERKPQAAKQEQETLFTQSTTLKKEEEDSPERGSGSKNLVVNRVNWTFMAANDGWDMVKDYDSESDDSSSEEEAPAAASADPLYRALDSASAGIEPPKKTKVKLKAVLKALESIVEDEDERKKLKKVQRRRKKSKAKEDTTMNVDTPELLSILPHLTRDEKRALLMQLLEDEEDEAARHVPRLEEFPKPRRKGGYPAEPRSLAASSKSRAAPSSAASAAGSEPPSNDDMPLAVKKKRLEEFRRQLYHNALTSKGRLRLSEASDVPNGAQDQCTHDYSLLKWGANGSAHWADCTNCRLKKVLYWSKMHGSLMVDQEPDEVPDSLVAGLPPTMDLIMDTGCRTAVAGKRWHDRYQTWLRERNLMWNTVEHEEVFRFGAGRPVLSVEAHLYPVCIGKLKSWMRLAVVESEKDPRVADCPALAGPSELSRWGVRMDFARQSISIGQDDWQKIRLSPSRHPVLNVLPPEGSTRAMWETKELVELREKLETDPYSMALLQEQVDEIAVAVADFDKVKLKVESMTMETSSEGSTEPIEEVLQAADEEFDVAAAHWQESMEEEAIRKWDELGLPPEAFRRAEDSSSVEDDTSAGTLSESMSISEEDANDARSDTSSETSSEGDNENLETILVADAGCADEEHLTKGQRRRLLAASKEIGEVASAEAEGRKPRVRQSLRPKGALRLIEIFTWSCMVTQVAFSRGFETYEPLTLPNWDLSQESVQKEAMNYLKEIDPDAIVVAWPCSPWSPLQHLNMRTPQQRRALRRKQIEARRTLLSFTRRVVLWQRRRGKAVIGENPHPSKAWNTPEILDAFQGCSEAVADQCQFGLKHPITKCAMKKRTRFMGQEEVVAPLRKTCNHDHEHWPIEGKFKAADGKWQALSEWAGGYPVALCHAIVDGFENFYRGRSSVYVEDQGDEHAISDGDMIDGEDAIHEEEEILDEALQKDEEDLTELKDDIRHPVPREVQKAVEFAHRQLGHPSRSTLVRMLKMSGATEDAVKHARQWQCPVCAERAAPKHPQAAKPSVRPYGFNQHIHVDIKYVYDIRKKKYACLSILDLGTVKHDAVMLKSKQSTYVAQKFFRHWVANYGPPGKISHDQGGEFERTFALYLEQMAVPSDVTAAHAGWQLGAGERHGGLLGDLVQAVVHEHSLEGYHQVKQGLAAAVAAKNSTITKDGYTPNQRVFGVEVKWPSLTDEEVKLSFAEGITVDSEVSRAHRMRTTARIALIRQDVKEKVRRSVLRKPAVSQSTPFVPGAQVFFWVPSNQKGVRYRKGGEWRGPATVLVREKTKRYFISWRGRLLLVAEENIRLSTKEELALNETIREDMDDVGEALRDGGVPNLYRDLRPKGPPPPRRPVRHRRPRKEQPPEPGDQRKARLMMRGTKTVRNIMKDPRRRAVQMLQRRRRRVAAEPIPAAAEEVRQQALAAPEQPALAAPEPVRVKRKRRQLALEDGAVSQQTGEEHETVAEEEDSPAEPASSHPPAAPAPVSGENVPVPEQDSDDEPNTSAAPNDEDFRRELERKRRRLTPEERQRMALDDVPEPIRKRLHEDNEEAPHNKRARVTEALVAQVMLGTLYEENGRANEWVSQYELALLRELTGLPLTSARLHRQPRKKMARPPKLTGRARLSILIGQDPRDAFVVEENTQEVEENPRRRASFPWRGISMYYKETPKDPKKKRGNVKSYVEKDGEIYEVQWSSRQRKAFEREWLAELKDILLSEVMIMKMKKSGKELDPKFFSDEEKKLYEESDRKEWSQWIQNGVVKRLTPEERKRVSPDMVFRTPMRMVRTNKQQKGLLPILAKSRLVLPGHTDPGLGMFRTDSPTTGLVAVRMAKAVAQFRGWTLWIFDVTTAFLSGLATDREIYAKAPPDGLPGTDGWEKILPYELLRIMKSAYGLAEAPRLWYLRAVQLIHQTPLREIPAARATFVASENGETYAILCLHVDDGLLLGHPEDRRYLKLKDDLNKLFKIKEWRQMPVTFLGVDIKTGEKPGMYDDMASYVHGIKVPEPEKKKGTEPLSPEDVTRFRQLTMRLRWPAQQAMPQKLYEVSAMAQKVNKATYDDFKEAVKLHGSFLEEVAAERGHLHYPQQKGKPYLLSFFDASLGKEEDGRSQLGGIHFLTTEAVKRGPALAAPIEYHSSRSTRVVRSSMAAESNAMSLTVDRHLYLRILLDILWTGEIEIKEDWRKHLRFGGGLVTDARSLWDHLQTTLIPTERQTMLDLLVAKDMMGQKIFETYWVPTHRQMADMLTKKMKALLWDKFCKENTLSLKETPQERALEEHRQSLRRQQRQRRKVKFGKAKSGSAGTSTTGSARN